MIQINAGNYGTIHLVTYAYAEPRGHVRTPRVVRDTRAHLSLLGPLRWPAQLALLVSR